MRHIKWQAARTGLFLLRSTHPGPSFAVTVVVVVLGIGMGLDAPRVIVLGFAILLGQFSVGLGNDWLDAERDKQSRREDKPIALGMISRRLAFSAAVATGIVGLALTSFLSLPATLAHAVFIASGWSYNLWLKRTAYSILPWVLGFGALPLVATLSLAHQELAPWWMIAAAALLGVAAHFANALPDLDADRATGVVGLPHRLAPRTSGVIIFLALLSASVLIVFAQPNSPTALSWLALAAIGGIAGVGIVRVWTRPPSRLLFQLVISGALVVVATLAVTLALSRS